MNRKFSFAFLTLTLSLAAQAGVKVTSLDLRTNGSNGYINIALEGKNNDLPDLKVYGNVIELGLPNSDAFSAISKTVRGALLTANVLNGKAIIKTVLPYAVSADMVNVGWKNKSIEVVFPRGVSATAPALAPTIKAPAINSFEVAKATLKEIKPEAPVLPSSMEKKAEPAAVVAPKVAEAKISKDTLNEDYLNKLMKEETTPQKKDEVKLQQAAPVKIQAEANVPQVASKSDNFSFAGYAAKFTFFLVAVLGLFYGVVQLLKKGVFNRGKLGFLNNSQMIQVLSTTYVAPKRSLMVVKAHNQIFLVANSESGLTFLSEMTDTSGLIKEGEKFVTGTNFDEKLNAVEAQKGYEAFIKVKEDIMESTPIQEEPKGLAKLASAKNDIVKFSDELKKKAKKLKPIEFN